MIIGSPTQPITNYHVYNVSSAANDWDARLDGLPIYTSTVNQAGFSGGAFIGSGFAGVNNGFNGDIVEILIYNQTLTDAQRTAVNTYLAEKYALYAAPSTPTNLAATPLSSSQVSLTWSDTLPSADTTYTIEREPASGGSYQVVARVHDALSYIDSGLPAATAYSYHITSSNGAGNAPGYSNEAAATTLLAETGDDPMPTDMLLWLKADAGVDNGQGPVTYWRDQSGHGNAAWQNGNSSALPNRVIDTVTPGGKSVPVISFNGSSSMTLPEFMSTATAGEMFIVLKAATAALPPGNATAVEIGGFPGLTYPGPDGEIRDSFGVQGNYYSLGPPTQPITNYHVYNVSECDQRLGGTVGWSADLHECGQPSGFQRRRLDWEWLLWRYRRNHCL